MDDIAQKAGLSTGIAYRYFKNKKELLLTAMSFAFEKLPAEMKEKLNIVMGLMENYCHAYMDKAFDNEELLFMREEVIRMVRRL